MFTLLLILRPRMAAAMVAVILMQRSEGGGLGVGGSPSGLMSARGAADFLTPATAGLATLFILLSILLPGLATGGRAPVSVDSSLLHQQQPARSAPLVPTGPAGTTGQPPARDPLAGAAGPPAPAPPTNGSVPVPALGQ